MTLNLKSLSVSFLLFSLLPLWVSSQQVYTLQDVIHAGLQRNYSLQVARNNETIAGNNVTLGAAGHLPVLSLRGQQSGTLSSADQTLVDGSRNFTRDIHNTTTNASVSLSWTLFDGFRARTSYERLESFQQLGELNTRMTVENLIGNISAAYYNYIQQINLLRNLGYSLELSRERVRIDEERYLIGSASKLQLLQAQVFMNADSSRLSRQYEVVRAARIRLNELMAMDDPHMMFMVADTSITVNPALMLEQLMSDALQNNTSLLIANQNKILSEYDRQLLAANRYPFLNFNSGYGYTHNTYQSGALDHQQVRSMNYGLTLGFNIFDGFNQRRRMSNALIEIENRALVIQQVETGLLADLNTIYHAYQNNLRLLQLEHQNLSVAHETLDIAIERYRLGALSGIELREAQRALLEAEERLLAIQYQTKLAEISLNQIAGRISVYL